MRGRVNGRRYGLVAVVLTVLVAATALPAAAATSTPKRLPNSSWPNSWSGSAAATRLGSRLPTVAARYGMSAHQLDRQLRSDHTLAVDQRDALYYVEPAAPAEPAHTEPAPVEPIVPNELIEPDAFALHSRPGAERVIYLDFKGELLSGTAWNSSTGGDCNAEPFNSEGTAGSFTTAERTIVTGVWQRVAEDYAPFDVDVTTEDPGSSALSRVNSADTAFGTRALITQSNALCPNGKTVWASVCNSACGGIAYLDVFDRVGSNTYYQPAFAFQNGLQASPKSIAEAVSHEVGHNLGLSHDGSTSGCGGDGLAACGYYSGHGAWAPIMGVGYYKPISQWSKGEYTGASELQDDFSLIQGNGLAVRSDDHGGAVGTATVLAEPGSVPGTISTATDTDWIAIDAGAGAATFTVAPAATSPNLDTKLTLRGSDGTILSTADPASAYASGDVATGLSASLSTTLTEGRYYLVVDGVGAGSVSGTGYSGYGSLGNYTAALSFVAGPTDPDPPDGTGPTSVTTSPGARWNLSSSIPVAWSASDSGSGVKDYSVERSAAAYNAPLGAYAPWETWVANTSGMKTGTRGYTYCFRTKARDNALNVGAFSSAGCTAIPLLANQLAYSSGWTSTNLSTVYGGAYSTASTLNSSVSRTGVVAKEVALVATKCVTCGTVKVYWNGALKKTVDLKAASTLRKQVISLVSLPSASSGTLKLVVSTSGKPVIIEGLGVSKL